MGGEGRFGMEFIAVALSAGEGEGECVCVCIFTKDVLQSSHLVFLFAIIFIFSLVLLIF